LRHVGLVKDAHDRITVVPIKRIQKGMKNPLSERVDNAEHEEDQSDLVERNSGLQKEIARQVRTITERNTSHTIGLSNTMARNDGRYNGR
jgi:hypothetical protein